MKLKEGKIFRNSKNKENIEIFPKEYDKSKNDYYGFIKKYNEIGLKQVIITSEIMIKLIEIYTVSRKFNINKIDFIVEDSVLDDEINMYLHKIREDRANLVYLLDHLKFLSHDDSIDIKSITLQGKTINTDKISRLIIRVNGLFSISDYSYKNESDYLSDEISGILNDR